MALTIEPLEAAITEIYSRVDDAGKLISLKPTQLIMPPFMYNRLMYRPPIRKAKGVRGRKRALTRRKAASLRLMFREKDGLS